MKLRVAAAPEHVVANDTVLEPLSQTLGVPRSALPLVSGVRARDKIVETAGVDPGVAEQRLRAAGRKDLDAT